MAFLKFIYNPNIEFSNDWFVNAERRFSMATPAEKCRFCLEQSIILSYLEYLYGATKPILLHEYRNYFESWFLPEIQESKISQNLNEYTKDIYISCLILLNKINGRIDSSKLIHCLDDDTIDCPHTVEKSFYDSFLKFKENVSDLTTYVENDQMRKVRSFNVNHRCTLPSFKFFGPHLHVTYEIEFTSYEFNYSNLKDIVEDMIDVNTIFTYLAGFHWSGKNSTGVFGILAAQCITYDINDVDPSTPMLGFLEIYSKVVNPSLTFVNTLSTAIIQQRRKIVRFLIYLRNKHRIVLDDTQMLADYADSIDHDDTHPLKTYLLSPPSEISSEVYTAFRNSRFGKFEELNKFHRNYRNAADGDDNSDKKKDSDDEENPDEESGTAPDSENQSTEDTLNGLESPTGIQDSSKNDTNSDSGDSATTTDAGQNSDEQTTDQTTEDDIPPLPRVSDKHGIKIKLSEGESPDTVLYREELRAYIDSLLNNPPAKLSAQTISAIKRLKANWLYLLDVECLYKFMSALIKLPKSFKVKPPKKEEK